MHFSGMITKLEKIPYIVMYFSERFSELLLLNYL